MAVIMFWISLLPRALSRRAFSTFSTFPRRGRIACVRRSRPILAEPPAESPSTMNSSHFAGSRSEQSASLPGRPPMERALLRTVSRALRAASRARAAVMLFSMIFLAIAGFSSKYVLISSYTTLPTTPSISVFTSLSFVWDEKRGLGILTEITATRPSRTSSPLREGSFSFNRPLAFA